MDTYIFGSVASVEAGKNVIDFSAKEESMLLKISSCQNLSAFVHHQN
jgi:hypothetical protein